ncbi:bifunctional DNA primase/polymerase [Alicyclobacillus fodiniaquatilis]|uniref:Bifunctional DNA primase/polymerase n=1 Tax=Alicyclobacillus fodiniaquatilis TaxID=1661150 RepID=A0ABW4JDW4_9BACL
METSLEFFSKHGFRLLPVNSMKSGMCTCGRPDCSNKGKHPRVTGWPEQATADMVQHAKWLKQWPDTNWALACGQESGVWVLDVDEKNGGYESLARLESEIGELPATVRVKTGGGGLHIYFAWPTDGTIITNAVNLKGDYPGLDVRGYRGYVVIPPGKHKSGNRYDWVDGLSPDDVSLAQAPQPLIEVIKNAGGSRTYADKPRDTRPWDSVPDEIILKKTPELCARIKYFTSEAGANDVSYEDWVALASWAHALTDDDSVFHEWSSAYDGYNKNDTGRKFRDTADMAPRSCHRAQADHPLDECLKCPLFEADKNPAYHVRVAYNQEQGGRGPWGAPPLNPEQRHTAYQEEREASMEALLKGMSEVAPTSEAEAPMIDVTEDDYEGESSTTEDAGQAHAEWAGSGPRFRVFDSIDPHVEKSHALQDKLRGGDDSQKLLPQVAEVLNNIKKRDEFQHGLERNWFIEAEKDGAAKKGYKARYTKKLLDDAVKSFAEHEAAAVLTKITTVGENWPDAPEEHHHLPNPTGYKYTDEGVEDGTTGVVVTSQPTYIAGWRKNITTGEIQVVIYTRTRDAGWIKLNISPSHLDEKRQTSPLRDQGCDFQDSSKFGQYLLAGYSMIRTRFGLEPEVSTSRLGWHNVNGQAVFAFPDETIGDAKLIFTNPLGSQLYEDYTVSGEVEQEWELHKSTVMLYPRYAWALGVGVAACLVRFLKDKGMLDIYGVAAEYVSLDTGSGKSTTAGAGLSIFGTPAGLRMFAATQVGVEQRLMMAADLPTGFTEAQVGRKTNVRGTNNNADPSVVIHMLGEGTPKTRSTRDGGLQHSERIHCTILMANNHQFLPRDAEQGERQRIFTAQSPFDPDTHGNAKELTEKILVETMENHGNGGRQMIRALLAEVGGSYQALQAKVINDWEGDRQAVDALVPSDVDADIRKRLMRRAKYVAAIRLGLRYLVEYGYGHPKDVSCFLDGVREQFVAIIKDEIRHSDRNVTWQRALSLIGDWITEKSRFVYGLGFAADDRPTDYIGKTTKVDGVECIAILPKKLDEFLEQENMPPNVVIAALAKAKMIIRDEKDDRDDRNVRAPWVSGKATRRMIVFVADKLGMNELNAPDEGEEQQIPSSESEEMPQDI